MKIQLFEKFADIRFPRTKHRVLVSCRTLWILSGLFFFCPTLCLNKSRFSSTSTFSQSCPPLVARQQLEERSCCQHCHGNWVSDSGGVGRSLFWFFFPDIYFQFFPLCLFIYIFPSFFMFDHEVVEWRTNTRTEPSIKKKTGQQKKRNSTHRVHVFWV